MNEVGETPEQKRIEEYLQKVGDKVAQKSTRQLAYKLHLDPHPGFCSAVAYPGGQIIVGGGVLALMQHDELAVVLGHEIAHVERYVSDYHPRNFCDLVIEAPFQD